MPAISGWLKSSSATKFVAAFMKNGRQFVVAGTFANSVHHPIQVSNATLIYSHENVLAGMRDLTTTVGITQFIVNSTIPPPEYISIIGTLDVPTAQVLQSPGNGSWVEN
ncbi:hypothetical protein B0H14DRAFT_3146314 [Mycena olivaceomarginata]|nr:hypothetical protein B0H14DRAFT_3146314 [Mycena olivaceomarginata]